jgi:hypothetical protein
MSFWRTFGFHTVSAIDTIFDRGDYTLEEFLEEEEILQESKALNKKLMEYLTDLPQLSKLFEYITQEPTDSDDPKRRYKYPFIACEILVADISPVVDAIFRNPELIDKLFLFLDNKAPLDPLLSNYVGRLIAFLLEKNPKDVLTFMKKHPNMITKFLTHMGSAAIMDLLLKLISMDDSDSGILQWLKEGNLIRSVLDKFEPTLDADVHEHAAAALTDIVNISNNKPSLLMEELESEETLNHLFKYILDEKATTSLVHGLTVVVELLRRNAKPVHETISSLDSLSPVLRVSLSHLPHFSSLLTKSNGTIPSTVGEIEPFGTNRLKILEFVLALLQTNYKCVEDKLLELDVITICLDLFNKFVWNNFLHAHIETLIKHILIHDNESLKLSLISKSKLLDKLIEADRANTEDLLKPKGIRRGNMGHLIRIVLALNEQMSGNNEELKKLINEHKEFVEYLNKVVEEERQNEAKPLGGQKPRMLGHPLSGFGGLSFGLMSGGELNFGSLGGNDDDDGDGDDDYDDDDDSDDDVDLTFSDEFGGEAKDDDDADMDRDDDADDDHADTMDKEKDSIAEELSGVVEQIKMQ